MKYIIITIFIITASVYILIDDDSSSQTVQIEQKKKIIQENTTKEKIQEQIVSTIIYVPQYIKDDMRKEGFNTDNITRELWDKFIEHLKDKDLKKISMIESEDSLLHLAVIKGQKDNIAKLLAFGADINQKDSQGMTPLLNAIRYGVSLDIVKLLIKNGADLDTKGTGRLKYDAMKFALYYAGLSKKNNDEIIDFLLENGFSFEKKYHLHLFPIKSEKRVEYIKSVIDSIDINEAVNPKSSTGYLNYIIGKSKSDELVSYLLETKIDLKTYPNKELLVVSAAMVEKESCSNKNFVKILNSTNIDINKPLRTGKTLFMWSIQSEDEEKIETLLKRGADINAKSSRGKNAYEFLESIKYSSEEKKEKIKKLLDKYK